MMGIIKPKLRSSNIEEKKDINNVLMNLFFAFNGKIRKISLNIISNTQDIFMNY